MAKAAGSKRGVKVLLAFFCSLMMQAQQIDTLSMTTESNSPLLGQLVVDGDTVPWSVLDEMLFVAKPTLSDFQARRNYYILMKKALCTFQLKICSKVS